MQQKGHSLTAAAGQWRGAAAIGAGFFGSLCLYLRTISPTVYAFDSAELTTAAATGGLVHPTGYPLYLMIGRFWSRIPVGDVGFRMNLLSALFGALTVALVVRVLQRLGVGPWAALCAAGLLASTRFFWASSLVAEVYTLHTALTCALILALLAWADRPSPARLAVATGLLGLAAANHVLSLLMAPACLIFVLIHDHVEALRPASIAAAAAGLIPGLSAYGYLPYLYLQNPKFNNLVHADGSGGLVPVDLSTVNGIVWTVTARQFSHLFFSVGGWSLVPKAIGLIQELWRSSFAIGFGPALVGAAIAFRRSKALGALLLVTAVANAAFFLSYGALDVDSMVLPVYLVWAIWTGLGMHFLLDMAFARSGWVAGTCLAVVLAGAVAFSVIWSFPLVDLSDDWSARERAEQILDALDANAVFLGSWTTASVIDYLRLVEGRRPDVEVVNRNNLMGTAPDKLLDTQVGKRPVYSDSASVYGREDLEARREGPVFRIEPRPPSDGGD